MKTEKISITKVKPGMILTEDVYNAADQLVLSEGTVLSDHSITRLKFYSIREVTVSYEVKKRVQKPKKEPEKFVSYTEFVKKSDDFKNFSSAYARSLNSVEDRMRAFAATGRGLDTDVLLNNVADVYSTVASHGQLFDMLMCIRDLDDITFVHGLNVAIICTVFAQWLGFNRKDSDTLILSGLLHDIGKLSVPESILKKKGALTAEEFEVIKGHAKAGYDLLKDINIDPRIPIAALQHHERSDGSGYPDGLMASHINEFAKIIAIADVYDAMTAARSYRGPICPLEVLNIFENDGLSKYDPKFLLTFMEHVISTYLNQYVLLSNGQIGEIVMVNKHSPARPIVRLLNSECIDLSADREVSIVGIV
ncbi:MAG: HD-GYP domain-containing protein [Lachnospiraceae bacterium]|nr:HD-GYP domain-containing protein [Lachnospiraceae bacterium]